MLQRSRCGSNVPPLASPQRQRSLQVHGGMRRPGRGLLLGCERLVFAAYFKQAGGRRRLRRASFTPPSKHSSNRTDGIEAFHAPLDFR